jgi:N-acyl amino acid synthase of PEP-CTERM/exosortase system
MAGVSHWQEFLSCYRQHFEVVRADTPSLLDDAYRLRYQVYCVENRYEDPGQQANGRERDVYDDRSVHSLLIHRRSGVAAGTMRVILPGTVTQDLPLPINTVTDSGLQQLLRQLPAFTHGRNIAVCGLEGIPAWLHGTRGSPAVAIHYDWPVSRRARNLPGT